MRTKSVNEYCSREAISKFAKRNYKTYLAHYKAKNLNPMSFEEFLKNYAV